MEFELRKWRIEDVNDVAYFANNEKIACNLRDAFPHPYTLADAREFINSCVTCDESRNMFRAIDINGRAVGSIGVFVGKDVYSKSAEIGYWLGEEYWGQGIMSRAISSVCDQAFDVFDIVRIYAEPFAENTGSRKALEKAGFVLEGMLKKGVCKNGRIMDYCMYGLVK